MAKNNIGTNLLNKKERQRELARLLDVHVPKLAGVYITPDKVPGIIHTLKILLAAYEGQEELAKENRRLAHENARLSALVGEHQKTRANRELWEATEEQRELFNSVRAVARPAPVAEVAS